MIALLLIFLPLVSLLVVWASGSERLRVHVGAINLTALLHCIGTGMLWVWPDWTVSEKVSSLVGVDRLSLTVLSVVSLLFLLSGLQTIKYFPMVRRHYLANAEKFLSPQLVAICLLGFLSSMTLVAVSRNFGLLWVAMEATTLASAPLIIFRRSGNSLEAMWKYILICSVGIGFALFGTMLLAIAGSGSHANMDMAMLGQVKLHPVWFKAAFVFILAGYGTKMGLAPFHSWMPDAYSEAPGVLSVLSSGALLACSFLGIARVLAIAPAEVYDFCAELLRTVGLISLALAAFFIVRQTDYKRMLAYSSMEHMGVVAILWSLGLEGIALVHIITHALLKVALFMTADNIQLAYCTQKIGAISGLLSGIRRNGIVYIVSILALCGMPPSPLFVTEMQLVQAAGPWLGGCILLLLFVVFSGMTYHGLRMTMNPPAECLARGDELRQLERLSLIPTLVLVLTLTCGVLLLTGFILSAWMS